MSIDFMQALKAPMQSENWLKKCIGLGFAMMIPVVNIISVGYTYTYLNSLIYGQERLPDVDFGKAITLGCKAILGSLLLVVPMFLLFYIVCASFGMGITEITLAMPVFYFILMLLTQVMIGSFAVDLKIISWVDIQRAVALLKGNEANFIKAIFCWLGLAVLAIVLSTISAITIVGLLLIPVIGFFINIAVFNVIGQFVKSSPQIKQIMFE